MLLLVIVASVTLCFGLQVIKMELNIGEKLWIVFTSGQCFEEL